MSFLEQEPYKTHFRCVLWWGRDPQIRLAGTACVLRVDSVLIRLEESDVRLLPEPGRKIRIEIEWLPIGPKGGKRLVCNGIVERVSDAVDGSVAIRCFIRGGHFRDAGKLATGTADVAHWRM